MRPFVFDSPFATFAVTFQCRFHRASEHMTAKCNKKVPLNDRKRRTVRGIAAWGRRVPVLSGGTHPVLSSRYPSPRQDGVAPWTGHGVPPGQYRGYSWDRTSHSTRGYPPGGQTNKLKIQPPIVLRTRAELPSLQTPSQRFRTYKKLSIVDVHNFIFFTKVTVSIYHHPTPPRAWNTCIAARWIHYRRTAAEVQNQ